MNGNKVKPVPVSNNTKFDYIAEWEPSFQHLHCIQCFDLKEKGGGESNFIFQLERIYYTNFIKFLIINRKFYLQCRLKGNFIF